MSWFDAVLLVGPYPFQLEAGLDVPGLAVAEESIKKFWPGRFVGREGVGG